MGGAEDGGQALHQVGQYRAAGRAVFITSSYFLCLGGVRLSNRQG